VNRRHSRRGLLAAAFAALVAFAATDAGAQGPPNAFEGFSKSRGQPVKITAAALEVHDKEKVATFSGDVVVTQGDTVMRCQLLVVFYDADLAGKDAKEDSKATAKAAPKAAPKAASKAGPKADPAPPPPGAPGQQQIRRMEATGGVVVNQKDQNATGDRADFDMPTNTVTISGNVVVTKGQDVLRGQRLVVNMTDGVSRIEGGRVDALINSTGAGKSPLSRPASPK
jgi:lipopolysaccharide export system protein LptA